MIFFVLFLNVRKMHFEKMSVFVKIVKDMYAARDCVKIVALSCHFPRQILNFRENGRVKIGRSSREKTNLNGASTTQQTIAGASRQRELTIVFTSRVAPVRRASEKYNMKHSS